MLQESKVPLYGCVTGIELPVEEFKIARGINISRGVFEIFSSPMLAFSEAPSGSHTPGPWVPVKGGFHFKSKVELSITDLSTLEGHSAYRAAWLIAALMRLRIKAPIRIAAIADMPLSCLSEGNGHCAYAFEASPHQIGYFTSPSLIAEYTDLLWLSDRLPITCQLMNEERFMRAWSIFDEAVWSSRVEMGATLIWTAIEILFDVSREIRKTNILCRMFSEFVGPAVGDMDNIEQVILDLYKYRGSIVHAGRPMGEAYFVKLYSLARAAFGLSIDTAQLPNSREKRQ